MPTTTDSPKEGFQNAVGTRLAFEGLASDDYVTIPVSIDASARDWGNPDGSNHLRPYLALGYDTSSGRYKQYKNPPHDAATVVVLAEEVRDMDSVSGFVNSFAFLRATFKKNVIVAAETAVTLSSVQRLIVRDNVNS